MGKSIKFRLETEEQDLKSLKKASREMTLGMDLRTRKLPRKKVEKGGSRSWRDLQ